MLYLVIETSIILLAAAVIFFILGAYYQRHFATKAAEVEETTGAWNVANAKDDEKEWLRRRLAELEGQLAMLANKRPSAVEPVVMDAAPTILEVESRLQEFVDERFEALQARLSDLHVTVTPGEAAAPVALGPDVATLNALAAVERRLTQAMAAQFASLHHVTPSDAALASTMGDDHLASVVERFAQELASVESRLTATMIDQLSAPTSHRDPAVDLQALAESFQQLETEIASGVHLPKPKDTSVDVRALADAFGRLERHVAAMANAPVNVIVNLDEVNARFDRLERTLAATGTPGQWSSPSSQWTDPGFIVPDPGNSSGERTGSGPALWAPTAGELARASEPTVMSEAATKELESIAASVAALEAGTHARFDGLERQMAAAMAPMTDAFVDPTPGPTTHDLEVIAASVASLEAGTHSRFDGLERQMFAAITSKLQTEPVATTERPVPSKELETIAASVVALETGTHARFDGIERQMLAAMAAKPETTLAIAVNEPPAPSKELEAIAASVVALETGTHARFDGIERQILASAKPAQASRTNADDRLERIERRLEEMSVRAEHSTTALNQIATSDTMDQLGEEMRDNAATLERRTVALEVELVRHRELLKKVFENATQAPAPVIDPANDPAVLALEVAKQDLAQRIDMIRETIDRHVAAAANEPTPDTSHHVVALEQKLDSIAYRIDQSTHGRGDTAPMIEALRMDLAGLRVAMLQSVAANRSPVAELHGIRTELERLRGSMDTVGKENHQHTARETELALRLSELERRGSDREREFEDRERRLDDEYQQRVVALERELESMERKLEREELEEAKVSGHDGRTQRLEERERRLQERESAMSERITVLERELSDAPTADQEVTALRERLAVAETQLARTSEERREDEVRRELERRMDERLAETKRDSRELRDELRDISTILRDAPEPPPVVVAPPVAAPVAVVDSSGSKEVLARIDRMEDLLWKTGEELRRVAGSKKEVDTNELAQLTAKMERALVGSSETVDRNLEGLHTAIVALRESFAVTLDRRAEQVEDDMERRFSEFRTMLDGDNARRDSADAASWERARETFTDRLEQLRSQLAQQLERQASEVKDAERSLADRFDLKLERSLEGVSESLHRELGPRFETLQMALRFGGSVTQMTAGPETDGRALSRLEDRLRDIEHALHGSGPSGESDEARVSLERERRRVAEELHEAERRSREKIRKLERELEAARTAPGKASVTETNGYREEDMPRGRFGMGGGFIDPSRILEEMDQRLSEAEERFEKLSKEGANVSALEAQLKTERDAREDLEDRLRDLEHRDRERQSSIDTALERTRSDQSRTTLELRSEMRRELDDRLRDAEDRMARRATPMTPPAQQQPMMGYGIAGPDAFAMNAMHDMDRRLREAMDSMRVRESAMTAAMEELRHDGLRNGSERFETALQEAVDSLEQRIEAMREDSHLSEPINAALRAFRERLESVEKVVDERDNDEMAPLLEKIEDRIREIEAKDREQASGMYADIDDLRRTMATERRTLEGKVETRMREFAERTPIGGNAGDTERLKMELSESNERTQKQLLAIRDYVVRLDKAIKPLEERIGGFESQLGARVDDGVSPEMIELLGERLTRLEIAPKPATVERVEAITGEVGSAIDGLRTVFSNALTRMDSMEQRFNGATAQIGEALTAIKAQSEDRIEDLVAHIDHLQEEMREEAIERDNSGGVGGVEPTELRRVEEEDMKRFCEVQERFERLEKSFGAKFDSVKHDLEENIHHSEERSHDDALSLTTRTDERLEKMVGGLEKLVAEKENIIADLSDRVKELTEQVHQNPDDLADIAGIGPKLRRRLKEEFGITTFKSLATIGGAELERLAGMLLFPDRIFREDWIGQARELHLRKYNELLSHNEAEGEMRMRLAS